MKRLILLLSIFIAAPVYAQDSVPAGSTSQIIVVQAKDADATDGSGKTGLAYNTSNIYCRYYREGAGTGWTDVTLASSTLGTYTSGCFKEIPPATGEGNGFYEVCLPDAAYAVGAKYVIISCGGAADMAQVDKVVNLISPNTYGYDGKLASESGTVLGLATGAVDADDQFVDSHMIVFFDSAGLVSASSCIEDSADTGDTVTTREDISARISVNDNYIIKPDAACGLPLSFSPGGGSGGGTIEDWFLILRRRRFV